jgi:hypothetical protein
MCLFSPINYIQVYQVLLHNISLLRKLKELAVAAQKWESRQLKVIENTGKNGIILCKEDFMHDLKLQ